MRRGPAQQVRVHLTSCENAQVRCTLTRALCATGSERRGSNFLYGSFVAAGHDKDFRDDSPVRFLRELPALVDVDLRYPLQ